MTNYLNFDFDKISGLAGVYMFTNNLNGKKYIGKSNNLKRRLKANYPSEIKYSKNQTYFLRALRKYGISNFSLEIVEMYSIDQLDFFLRTENLNKRERLSTISKFLCSREAIYIGQFKTTIRSFGYNRCSHSNDPSGITRTEDHKKKISLKLSGRKLSNETKSKLSLQKIGDKNPQYGTKRTPEEIARLVSYNKGKKLSPEIIENLKKFTTTPVHQIDLKTGEIINTFKSMSDAARANGLESNMSGQISRVAAGTRKSCGGFSWRLVTKEEAK